MKALQSRQEEMNSLSQTLFGNWTVTLDVGLYYFQLEALEAGMKTLEIPFEIDPGPPTSLSISDDKISIVAGKRVELSSTLCLLDPFGNPVSDFEGFPIEFVF